MYNPSEIEKGILQFWKDNDSFNKLRIKNQGKKKWRFLDGPITANNPMGVHHAWGRTYKDLFQRFKAMQGFDERYQNGFDCQGLWVEREEEKDLGLKNKADIEKFGILNFVLSCKKRIQKFSAIQRDQSIRLGQWMDWDNSYYTMTDKNNLHNWHLLKTYFDNGSLYKGKDAVPWCPRCGTASSKHDIATEGYKEVTHSALFMQFPVKDKENEYFLIFTTTPWTVPADIAIAVNENLDYVKVRNQGSYYWLAESRLNELEEDYEIIEKKKGKELKGWKYIMPYRDIAAQKGVVHRVVLWELASGEEGTGIVHIAPGCGAEDFDLGIKEKLQAVSPLDEAGIFKEGFGEFSLRRYSEVSKAVLEDLDQTRHVYKIVPYKHRYPHCWRCGEELVFRLVDEWYIKGDKIRKKLIKENKKVKWFPEYGKTRQEDWFNNMGDWLISRKRYWGLPLPIWECSCGEIEVFGSLEELKSKAIDKTKVEKLPEVHRPWVDEIKVKCKKCGKEVERVKDVGDAWLDAGIVSFSTLDYLNNRKYWEQWYPFDFISENMPGQYRGWFNALMWASVTITGKAPFKSVFGYETLKDEKGEEMHKSKGNAIWFDDAVEKIGADPMRLLYMLQDPSQELKFGFNVAKEPKNNINILYNLVNLISKSKNKSLKRIEDKWIFSRLNNLIKTVTEELENLHPHLAARALQNFWLNEFSRGYIQLVRDRIAEDDAEAKYVVKEVYLALLKLCAPIIPFITEKAWQELRIKLELKEESIHHCDWPKVSKKYIDLEIESSMALALEVIQGVKALREKEKVNIRWPLSETIVYVYTDETAEGNINRLKSLSDLILQQVNVKKISFKTKKKEETFSGVMFSVGELELDTKMTKELEEEGYARELMRRIQSLRKEAGLKKEDLIELLIDFEISIKNFEKQIKERCGAKNIVWGHVTSVKHSVKDEVKGKRFDIGFNVL